MQQKFGKWLMSQWINEQIKEEINGCKNGLRMFVSESKWDM